MVEFGTGYQMPMDRDYGNSTPADNSTNDVGVGLKDFGMSIGLGPVPNVHAIGAKLRAGSKTMELSFMGAGKGSGQAHTPEYYGKKQREALVEMTKANKTDFTTHASVNIQGLAGLDQQGNFSETNRSFALNEIKRAIEFAGDVARGGPVVVHTGEFQRPLVDADWNEKGEYKEKFRMYPEEADRAAYRVIDRRHGGLIQEARKNRRVARPVWNKYEPENEKYWKERGGKSYKDEKGQAVEKGNYIDYYGNKVSRQDRKARFNPDTQKFDVVQMDWDELKDEAKVMTEEARELWQKWKRGEISDEKFKETTWGRFIKAKSADEVEVRPEEAYIIATLETNAANSRGWAFYYSTDFEKHVEAIKKLKKAKEFYDKIKEETDPEEQWRLKQQARGLAGGLVPEEAQFPSEVIEEEIKSREGHISHAREGAASQFAQAEEAEETMRYVQSAETYAKERAYDSYAQAGIFAMEQSRKLEAYKKMEKPLSISMENLFPESYGSHPDEIIDLVLHSREKMAELLKTRGASESEARKEAKEHINATIDSGHMNMWRKYWQGDEKKSIEENDKDFNQWMVRKFEEMAKKEIIGHIHLTDNYGYQDDHLAPGEGNTPIREVVKTLKEHGYQGKLIVEPGADWSVDASGFHSVMKAWRLFGSPVYGAVGGVAPGIRNWGDVQYGWFGQNQPPYFVFQPYSPSEDWTLWSGVPLE